MKYLFLDASNSIDTFAQIGDENSYESKIFKTNRDFAAKITKICDEMLQIKNLKISDIDTLVLGTGPGSLTGLRVAAAFFRTLSMLNKCRLIGVNQFLWSAFELKTNRNFKDNFILVMPTLIDKAFLVEGNAETLILSEPKLIERNEIPNQENTYGINFSNSFVTTINNSGKSLHELIVNHSNLCPTAKEMPDLLKILPMYVIPSQAERKFKFNGGENK